MKEHSIQQTYSVNNSIPVCHAMPVRSARFMYRPAWKPLHFLAIVCAAAAATTTRCLRKMVSQSFFPPPSLSLFRLGFRVLIYIHKGSISNTVYVQRIHYRLRVNRCSIVWVWVWVWVWSVGSSVQNRKNLIGCGTHNSPSGGPRSAAYGSFD